LSAGPVALRNRAAPGPTPTLFTEEASMQNLRRHLAQFLRDEDGPTAVEYGVMTALIIVVCIVSVTAIGTNSNNTYSYVATKAGKTGS
jgi:pilus assembly protein Flp/PilA